MHTPQQALKTQLDAAATKVVVGGTYSHYKHPEQTYRVLHIAIAEADDTLCVIYQAQYGEHIIFVRPLSNWLDTVEWQGTLTPRFA